MYFQMTAAVNLLCFLLWHQRGRVKKMQPSSDAACNLDVAGETTGVS